MASVNKVILVGNLGRDPEVRYMPNGEAVCTFSIATTDSWKDKNGQKQERTEWHNIILYRRLAEIAGEYLKKGRPVYIEGRIQSRKYTGKDGVELTAFEILATELQMLGSREESGANTRTERSEPTPPPPRRQAPKPASNFDDMDDDIPFAPLGLQYRFGLHCI
ncbi:single-stranded DNA-binding protein [Laribacter hongkongensis]|uniref:single-stranded DNA-binding protein n=1 Tax=Laribacter hongkongensis TaxID=168471 RepID=UPI001EFCBE32|nr:single-stranded DNA-binding protein [Laribacter hongkongensis]MCG8994233.1 single-stranded DNA-binding protein [Laribacter hongkongensis]MCG9009030.1 single-stranded DNA-binding protein [Laribacter hongkongensis]MCG9021479.1 single-stranded DNA-binding protein [Laribacter hongkongensis]MCG9046491.1 single-stranded DNA-binding protein [Laribacter hongkongensis]MCG9072685.1 single-stranded DNA-binding protein [Laribacter hongkongensis]